MVGGTGLKQVGVLRCLGTLVTADGGCVDEVGVK